MNDDPPRREFWRQQMEAACEFMAGIRDYPVEERGEPLASLPDAVRTAGVKVEFSTSRLGGQYDRIFFLREGLVPGLIEVARAMNARGWVLKIEDGYRSRDMQRNLSLNPSVFDQVLRKVIWELKGQTPSPDFMFRRITAVIATCPKIGTHMSGSAIDVSVLQDDRRTEVDRGAPYLEMSERTPMASPFVSDAGRRNRVEIARIMEAQGFMAYPYEFWHYSRGDAYAETLMKSGRPGRYGAVDWDPATRAVTPILSPGDPLRSNAEIQSGIEAALKRTGL